MKRLLFLRLVVGLVALPATAAAFDPPRLVSKKSRDTERVVLPAREIEIVNERPRVTVREEVPSREVTREVVRDRAPVREVVREAAPVGTIYVPAPPREVVREVVREEPSSLESAQRAIIRGETARYEIQRNIEVQRRILECTTAGAPTVTVEGSGKLEQKLNQLVTDLNKLDARLTSAEKLLLYHNTMLVSKKGEAGADADGLKARVDALEKLVLYLNKKATEPAPTVPVPPPGNPPGGTGGLPIPPVGGLPTPSQP